MSTYECVRVHVHISMCVYECVGAGVQAYALWSVISILIENTIVKKV